MAGPRQIKVTEDNGTVKEATIFLPNIRDIIGFLNGEWNLAMYDDCFEGKNRLGDIDASIELYGHSLLIEFKRNRSALTGGQLVKAIRQAKHSNVTTFFVFGETNHPTEYLRFSPKKLEGTGFVTCSVIGLCKALSAWGKWAKRNDLTKPKDEDWTIAKRYLNSVGGGKKS